MRMCYSGTYSYQHVRKSTYIICQYVSEIECPRYNAAVYNHNQLRVLQTREHPEVTAMEVRDRCTVHARTHQKHTAQVGQL